MVQGWMFWLLTQVCEPLFAAPGPWPSRLTGLSRGAPVGEIKEEDFDTGMLPPPFPPAVSTQLFDLLLYDVFSFFFLFPLSDEC